MVTKRPLVNIIMNGDQNQNQSNAHLQSTGIDIGNIFEDERGYGQLQDEEPRRLDYIDEILGETINGVLQGRLNNDIDAPIHEAFQRSLTAEEIRVADTYMNDVMSSTRQQDKQHANIALASELLSICASDDGVRAVHQSIETEDPDVVRNQEQHSVDIITESESTPEAPLMRNSQPIGQPIEDVDDFLFGGGSPTVYEQSVPDIALLAHKARLAMTFYRFVYREFGLSQTYDGKYLDGTECGGAPSPGAPVEERNRVYWTRQEIANLLIDNISSDNDNVEAEMQTNVRRFLDRGMYRHFCPSCQTLFRNEQMYQVHMVNANERFWCPYRCGAESNTLRDLQAHLHMAHRPTDHGISENELLCEVDGCGMIFRSTNELSEHTRSVHGNIAGDGQGPDPFTNDTHTEASQLDTGQEMDELIAALSAPVDSYSTNAEQNVSEQDLACSLIPPGPSATQAQLALSCENIVQQQPIAGSSSVHTQVVMDSALTIQLKEIVTVFYKLAFRMLLVAQSYKRRILSGNGCPGAPTPSRMHDKQYVTKQEVETLLRDEISAGFDPHASNLDTFARTFLENGRFKYICASCSTVYKHEQLFELHFLNSTSGLFACPYECGEESTTGKRIRAHIKNKHRSYAHQKHNLGEFKCQHEQCNRCFLSQESLSRHVTQVHDDGTRTCRFCKIVFDGKAEMDAHYLVAHRYQRQHKLPYLCSEEGCNVRLRSKRLLQEHMATVHEK